MKKQLLSLFCVMICWSFVQAQDHAFTSLTYPFAMQSVELEQGVRLAYTEQGNGKKTLLFVHGLGSYAPAWHKNIAELSKHYRCIAIDLPGYGQSGKDEAWPYDMRFFAEVIRDFILKKDLHTLTLVGHSMGGQIAMTFAMTYPNLLDKLVLIAPAGLETFTEQEANLLRNFTSPEMIAATPTDKIETNLKDNFNTFPEDARFMLTDRLAMIEEKAAFAQYSVAVSRCVAGMLAQPVFEHLQRIRLPLLMLYGKDDRLIPNRYLHPQLSIDQLIKEAKEKMPQARTALIDDAGHFVNFEKAETVNKNIKKFVR
ncbi:MAG: alpha/beta fold hydrolase [Bernardetiaceae bacterium]